MTSFPVIIGFSCPHRIVCVLVWFFWLTTFPVQGQMKDDSTPILKTTKEVRQLPKAESGSPPSSVHLKGIVTYSDPQRNLFYLQDDSGGVGIRYLPSQIPPSPGELLEVRGIQQITQGIAEVDRGTLKSLGKEPRPSPMEMSIEDVLQGKDNSRFLRLQGMVRTAFFTEHRRLQLLLDQAGKSISVVIREGFPLDIQPSRLVDSTIVVRGVCHRNPIFIENSSEQVKFISDHWDDLQMIEEANANPFAIPVSRIDQCDRSNLHRVHLRGKVVSGADRDFLTIEDGTGQAKVYLANRSNVRNTDVIDAIGFVRSEDTSLVLRYASIRILRGNPEAHKKPYHQWTPEDFVPVYEKIEEIRNLSPEEAAKKYPVRIRGVLTFYGNYYQDLFVQDETGAIYVRGRTEKKEAGDLIEIDGETTPGDYSPDIVPYRCRTIGRGHLPLPQSMTAQDLHVGRLDCQWVEVLGVVQRIISREDKTILVLASIWGVHAVIIQETDETLFLGLRNARVQIRGVYIAQKEKGRSSTNFDLFTPAMAFIRKTDSPPADPFGQSTLPIQKVRQFQNAGLPLHYIKVSGVVVGIDSEKVFSLQDPTGAIRVRLEKESKLAVGDHVETIGFARLEDREIRLELGIVRPIESNLTIDPKTLNITKIDPELDGQLVRIDARFLGLESRDNRWVLRAQNGNSIFEAILPPQMEGSELSTLLEGSQIRLRGICRIKSGSDVGMSAFYLNLRSTEDIDILEHPSWWTVPKAMTLLGIMASTIVLILTGFFYLRHRVHQQTKIIRNQVQNEARLEARYRDLFEHAHDAIFSINVKGELTAVNPSLENLLGYRRHELLNQPLMQYVESDPGRVVQQLFRGEDEPFEVEMRTRNQGSIILEVSPRVIKEGEVVTGAQGIARDISERKRLEEELRQSHKMEAVGRLAGGVAHDFNNLLTVINGCSDLLSKTLPDDSQDAELAREIAKSGERAAALTRQLLAFSRKSVTHPKVHNLNQIIVDAVPMLRHLLGPKIGLELKLMQDTCPVKVDAVQMEMVLMNLTVNAKDAMLAGGTLSIRTNLASPETVHLEVADSGVGMDEATRLRIFEPYFSTKPQGKGTGLGLATVYGIIQVCHGTITVESEEGRGTTFLVDLPRADEALDVSTSKIKPNVVPSKSRDVVLLVEDEPSVRLLELRVLEMNGYEVIVAPDGVEALKLVESNTRPIRLLVTDVVMPYMNGRELAERLIRALPDLKVLFLSGYTSDELLRDSIVNKGTHFLQKPFTPQGFARKVKEVLASESA